MALPSSFTPAPTTTRPTPPGIPATASPAASSSPNALASARLPRPRPLRYDKVYLGQLQHEKHGRRQASGKPAAFPASVDLPADAHHADVDRPPHHGFR